MEDQKQKKINFIYEKSKDFSSKFVSGVYGGIGPKGKINAYFFDEKFFIPEIESVSLNKDGSLNQNDVIYKRESGVKREVYLELIMDYEFAVVLHQWLGEKMVELEKRFAARDK